MRERDRVKGGRQGCVYVSVGRGWGLSAGDSHVSATDPQNFCNYDVTTRFHSEGLHYIAQQMVRHKTQHISEYRRENMQVLFDR